MKIGFTGSHLLNNKLLAIYAIAMTAVSAGILLLPAQAPKPNVVYNLFKIGQTAPDQTLVANGWRATSYSCQAAAPEQIAQGFGPTVCGYNYVTASHNLITNAGIDWLKCVMNRLGRCSLSNVDQYIAVGNPASCTELATDTTLTNELTTGSMYNGANRWAGTFTPNNGTATYTQVVTFFPILTFTGICESGLFTKGTAGTMVFENHFSLTNVNNGDSLQVTWSVTL